MASSLSPWYKLTCNTLPLRSFINGRFVSVRNDKKELVQLENNNSQGYNNGGDVYHRLYDAATGKERDEKVVIPSSWKDEVEEAVEGTRKAQERWVRDYTIHDRCEILRRAAQLLSECEEEVAVMESKDTGRPIRETRSYDAIFGPQVLEYYASLVSTSSTQHQQRVVDSNTAWAYTMRQPLGVTVGIGTWNYPLINAIRTSAPALAFGNGIVFKPAELTPTSALCLARIYQEAGLDSELDGLYNVVLGGSEVGEALVQHHDVSKVSFVGSTSVGRTIYQNAAASFKQVSLEMGGKSPLIVCDDCVLEDAVHGAMMANWYSNGQVCSNGTRVYVHSSIYDSFVQLLVQETSKLIIGHPLNPNTDIGPMVSRSHMERVLHYIHDIGVHQDKATLLHGGLPLSLHDDGQGYYLSPAIFADCHDDMVIVQQEIFGMVMTIMSFDDDDEVIRRANQSKYGLAAGVFTQNLPRAHTIIQQLHAGITWINHYNIAPIQLPWAGWKQSGLGTDDNTMEAWTKPKSVFVEMGHLSNPYQK